MVHTDILVIGGGIVGLATAYRLSERGLKVTVLEKEAALARHQSGRNSGVLHSGIYYKPGSRKAKNCRAGKEAMEDFCRRNRIPFERCGKVIVATHEDQFGRLEDLYRRGKENGVDCHQIGPSALRRLEPHAAGLRAVHVPEAGIVDYRAVCAALASRVSVVRTRSEVTAVEPSDRGVAVRAGSDARFHADRVVNCAGLHSDRVARLAGVRPEVQILPFRGDYYVLTEAARRLCRGLIYPVPDPQFPFLGVHFTRMISGGVECGPNALLALGREAYGKLDVNLRDLWESVRYPGLWKLFRRHWRMGLHELLISFSKRHYVRDLRELIPSISGAQLLPRVSGIRAQALRRDGTLVDDFVIQKQGRIIHVLNSPSPAATASLEIGEQIARELLA